MSEKTVCVIGGGASGLLAAGRAAELGARVTLIERNEKLGKKLYITGKGRCNLTNLCERGDFFSCVLRGDKFLYSAVSRFSPVEVMRFFEERGVPLKVERGNRVFPVSDKSSDIIRALTRYAADSGVDVRLNERVVSVLHENGVFEVKTADKTLKFDKLLLATGGLSYPSTGSTGDGYAFARALGHSVSRCSPSLVPILVCEDVSALRGLSLKNVELSVLRGDKTVCSEFGEMLFTDNGVSGPVVLKFSAILSGEPLKGLLLSLDIKPALTAEALDNRVLRDFSESNNKRFKNALDGLLPKSLILYVIQRSGIDPEKQINSVTREERLRLVGLLKGITFRVGGLGGFDEAVVTRGGVELSCVNPKTMESKICKGLYFAGELLDLDAYTGGFNLQIAFSTAYAAAEAIAASVRNEEN